MFEDIHAVLPQEEIKAHFEHLLATRPGFQNLVENMRSEKFIEAVLEWYIDEELDDQFEWLSNNGADVLAINLPPFFGQSWELKTKL